jgi:hypothetical protein
VTKCSYSQQLQLQLVRSVKDLYANAINVTLSVSPVLKVLDAFDFKQIISSNLPTSSITASYSSGQLSVRLVYTQSIQNIDAILQMSPPTSYDNTFDMKASSISFGVSPENT